MFVPDGEKESLHKSYPPDTPTRHHSGGRHGIQNGGSVIERVGGREEGKIARERDY